MKKYNSQKIVIIILFFFQILLYHLQMNTMLSMCFQKVVYSSLSRSMKWYLIKTPINGVFIQRATHPAYFLSKKDLRKENSCFESNLPENTSYKDIGKYLVTMMYGFERKKSSSTSEIRSMKIKENLVTRVNGEDVIHDKNIRIDRLVAQIFGYSFTNVKVSDKGRERGYINLIKSPRRILRQCLEIFLH